jgi:hypothetical protein
MVRKIVDLEVHRSSRGGGTSHFNGLAGKIELIASQKPDWEAYGKQRRDFSGAALRISSSSPATREDAAGTHATAELARFGSKALKGRYSPADCTGAYRGQARYGTRQHVLQRAR